MAIKLTRRMLIALLVALPLLCCCGLPMTGYIALWLDEKINTPEVRFRASRAEFDAYADRVMAAAPDQPILQPPRSLGKFAAGNAERLPHGFLFFADYGHPLDANGFAYSTEPLPEHEKIDGHSHRFTPIEGNWYFMWRN